MEWNVIVKKGINDNYGKHAAENRRISEKKKPNEIQLSSEVKQSCLTFDRWCVFVRDFIEKQNYGQMKFRLENMRARDRFAFILLFKRLIRFACILNIIGVCVCVKWRLEWAKSVEKWKWAHINFDVTLNFRTNWDDRLYSIPSMHPSTSIP